LQGYRDTLRLHVLPALGRVKVRQLHKGHIRNLLTEKLQGNLARNSVRLIHATIRALLSTAVDEGLIVANPASKLGRQFRLAATTAARQEQTKAMTRFQLEAFLYSAARVAGTYEPFFLLLARTGMRLGEGIALKWDDIDFNGSEIRVERAFSGGRIETPKTGYGRTVDMSEQLARALKRLEIGRATEKLRRGWRDMPAWVFCTEAGTLLDPSRVRKVFRRVLKAASLPPHFSPHGLRHTFASLLLQQGESPVYVQRQLGHSSIKMTVDTYGKWLPMGNKAAVNRLDDRTGSKTVASAAAEAKSRAEMLKKVGSPGWARTSDPLINSQVLYRLSYRGM